MKLFKRKSKKIKPYSQLMIMLKPKDWDGTEKQLQVEIFPTGTYDLKIISFPVGREIAEIFLWTE
jgi:hypothetical protein